MQEEGPHAKVKLINGICMPLLGLGTYKMTKENVEEAIPAALDSGYRLFDTATVYRNEEHVGNTLKREMEIRGMDQSQIFVTSKLQTLDQGYEAAASAIDTSLAKLGLGYIDLYLIHWPGASGIEPSDPRNRELRQGSWKALEEALIAGKLKAIGVSNFLVSHLKEMKSYAKIMPMVNQIELHPLYYPKDTIEYCQSNGIFIQAYSSLGRGKLLEPEFTSRHPPIVQMAEQHGATLSQIYLCWAWQHSFGIIPKSNNPKRIRENIEFFRFKLSDNEMEYLDSIHSVETVKLCWDPKLVA